MSGEFYGFGSLVIKSQCVAKDGTRRPVEDEEEDAFGLHTWSPLGPGMMYEAEARLDWRLILIVMRKRLWYAANVCVVMVFFFCSWL